VPALDTNVLIRYLVRDDPAQLAAAERVIRRCVSEHRTLFIPVTVALEVEWVLRSNFGYAKQEIIGAISDLLSAAELSFQCEQALEVAMELYRGSSADFADCLHVALSRQTGEAPLWTFDRGASRVDGARLISRGA
jgi:predicted nucleic-acid-binding protein